MSKLLALVCLLSLLGGSMVSGSAIYVQEYGSATLGSENFIGTVEVAAAGDCVEETWTSATDNYITITTTSTLYVGCPSTCATAGTGTTDCANVGSGVTLTSSTTTGLAAPSSSTTNFYVYSSSQFTAPTYYVGVYTSESATTLIDVEHFVANAALADQSDTSVKGKIAKTSTNTATLSLGCGSSCTAGSYTSVTGLTVGTTAPSSATAPSTSNGFYYAVTTYSSLTQPSLYVSVYFDSSCSEAGYIQEDKFVVNAAPAALTSTDSTTSYGAVYFDGATFTVWYGSDSTPADGDLDGVTTLTLSSDSCVGGTTFYYKLTTAATGYTAATKLYVAYYSAADCLTADFVGEDQFTIKTSNTVATTPLSSDSSLYGGVTYDFPVFSVYDRCLVDT